MGKVISFSEFPKYYSKLSQRTEFVRGTIFDTNILIAIDYEVNLNHDEVLDFIDHCLLPERRNGFRFFTTVNTRSEYLDFHRRLIMTEQLRDIILKNPVWKLSQNAKTQIQYQSGILKRRENQGSDPVFNDSQIKAIKAAFSAGRFSGQLGWIDLCDKILKNRLDEAEQDLFSFGIEYISQHEPSQRELFSKMIDWPEAKNISEKTCLGLSDSMILNASQCSHFSFILSADFDVGYAALADSKMKDVVMPDSVAKTYRDFHFETYG